MEELNSAHRRSRDRAAFLRLRGLNKMPKAFLVRTEGASVLGGFRGHAPRKIFKINASRMAKNTSQYIIYQANKHQI